MSTAIGPACPTGRACGPRLGRWKVCGRSL